MMKSFIATYQNRLMASDLRDIYQRGYGRDVEFVDGKFPSWYKQPRKGASCPAERYDMSVAEIYWNAFGCTPTESVNQRFQKALAAKTCASERMAEMHHLLETGKPNDKGHVYPIKLAYGIGKKCLKMNRGVHAHDLNEYDADFHAWYNQLKQAAPKGDDIDVLFQKENQIMHTHPLTSFNITRNNGIRCAQKRIAKQKRHTVSQRNETRQAVSYGMGAGAAATAPLQSNLNRNTKNNQNVMMSNNNAEMNNNAFLSSSFAHQKPKGKKKQGGRRQTHRRRALHKKATRRR
jgi:hypothetical protein